MFSFKPARSRSTKSVTPLVALGLAAVPVLTTVPAESADAAPAATSFVSRMNARWSSVTDTKGQVWAARSATLGTTARSTLLEGKDVRGTTDDVLYQVNAHGVTGYQLAVPQAGVYRVRLLMAEDWYERAGQRVFDVAAEGKPAVEGIDIAGAVGKGAAHDVTFDVAVTDGRLDLSFLARVDKPLVSSIEVTYVGAIAATPQPTATTTAAPAPSATHTQTATPTPTATSTTSAPPTAAPEPQKATDTVAQVASDTKPTGGTLGTTDTEKAPATTEGSVWEWRMTAGSSPVVDSAGRTWARRGTTFGAPSVSTALVGKDIAGTNDDDLYRRTAWGAVSALVPVPEAGTYRVRLLMAEDFFGSAGNRVFDVTAEGATVAAGVDVAKAVGKGAAHQVTFEVPVTDGELDLGFVKRVDNPLVSAIEVVSTAPIKAPSITTGGAITFSPASFYTEDISKAPLAANSSSIVTDLTSQVKSAWNGVAGVNAYRYNSSFYKVPADQPKVRVGFWDCQNKGYTPYQLFNDRKHFVDVPVPNDAQPAVGTDGEMTVYDPSADKVWEFWQMRRSSTGGWEACWGGRLDNVSTSQGVIPAPYGATASGLVMAGGMISLAEAKAGQIDHAMYLGVINAKSGTYSWPANRTDGNSSATNMVAEGQRLRLDPSIDVTTLGLTPFGEMVARAAQKHGFVVSDRAGAVSVITESGQSVEAKTGKNPWDVLLGGPDYTALKGFPWHRLQALPMNYGKR